jgi:hypothetical protein
MGQTFVQNSTAVLDIVFDLDNTLIFTDFDRPPDIAVSNPNFGVKVPFRLAHGTLEVLCILYSMKNVRISYYSAGETWRNVQLVPKLLNMVSARSEQIKKRLFLRKPPTILSKEQLSSGKKDLLLVHTSLKLTRALLVDDQVTSAQGQEANLLKIYGGLSSNYAPDQTTEDIFCIKNNLLRALGIIMAIMEHLKVNGALAVPQILGEILLHEHSHRSIQYISPEGESDSRITHMVGNKHMYYEKGLHCVQQLFPTFEYCKD